MFIILILKGYLCFQLGSNKSHIRRILSGPDSQALGSFSSTAIARQIHESRILSPIRALDRLISS